MVSAICAKLHFADGTVDRHVSEKPSVLLIWEPYHVEEIYVGSAKLHCPRKGMFDSVVQIPGATFEVVSDHISLKWLINQSNPHGRLVRGTLKLQGL